MSKQFKIKVNGTPYLVEVEEIPSATQGRQSYTPQTQESENSSFQPRVVQGSVSAPMPGVVTKVICATGEQVEVGQVILVLEAMKMENEITADKAGIVQEIRVNSGQSVAAGEILAVIA
ncbi:MAG TPA: biotin/lipoyl-containing protein [Verrucomicrobiae bacterium]|nr:biotin/lipoyl-containing protein [Verrucomicrobiae bacterium]